MSPALSPTPAECPWEIEPLKKLVDVIPSGIYGTEGYGAARVAMPVATTAHIDDNDSWNDKEMTVRFFTEDEVACYAPEEGDLVVVKSSGSAASIRSGKIGFVSRRKAGSFIFSNFLMLLRPTGCNQRFLFYQLTSGRVKRMLPQLVEASTYPNLRLSDYLRIDIPLPSEFEQRAITEALSDVDGLLGALDALIAKKRAMKLAAMQQLLTGKTRLPGFSGQWETKRLGDFVRFLRHGTNSRAELSNTGSVRYLHYGDIHTSVGVRLDARVTPMPYLSADRARTLDRLGDGDLVLVDASEDLLGVGKSVEITGAARTEVVAGLHTIAARFDKTILADGFKAYLQFCPAFRNHLKRLAAGTKVYATNRAHVASAEMALPSVKEQTAIASILSDMDAEIAALESRREKTRAIKEGMMQQLLTGLVRIVKPVSAEASA